MLTKTSTIQVFAAYAEKDVNLYKELSRHLEPLKRTNKIQISDMHATTTEEGRGVRLDNAQIILALITPNFLLSQACRDIEAVAMHKHVTKSVPVIAVLMTKTDLENTHFADLECIPKGKKPVMEWKNLEEGLEEVVSEFKEILYSL